MKTATIPLRRGCMSLPRFVMRQKHASNRPQQQIRLLASTTNNDEKHRPDPMARRPTAKCDPFGQGGKPLILEDAMRLSATVDSAWKVETEMKETKGGDTLEHPSIVVREFQHPDFMSAASFLQHVAAVAQMNDHFPSLAIERKLNSRKKQWTVVSTVQCHTKVLGGLSHHDFFLATLIDVEIERAEVKSLIVLDG